VGRRVRAAIGARRFAIAVGIAAVAVSAALAIALWPRPRGPVIPPSVFDLENVNSYPHVAPFSEVRWRDRVPEVRVGGAWWELVSIDGVPSADVVAHCLRHYPDRWGDRFGEDLVAMMAQMGHALGPFASLELRDLATGAVTRHDAVPLTEEN